MDAPLYLGYVYGVRSWRYERGNLLGVMYKQRWINGVNQALCRRAAWDSANRKYKSPRPIRDHGHNFERCTCGFHAYLEGSADYRGVMAVSGVVKLYGLVIPGSQGFRAEKAVIVALHLRTEDVEPGRDAGWIKTNRTAEQPLTPAQAQRLRRNYRVPFYADFDQMVAAYPLKEQS